MAKYKSPGAYVELFGAIIYYGGLALLNVYNPKLELTRIESALGTIIFIIGEMGNCYHHYLLAQLRKKKHVDDEYLSKDGKHVMPNGGLFDLVSTPHYTFEIMSWFGWCILNEWSLGSIAIFGASTFTLIVRSLQIHKRNINDFKKWPKHRKALIPFVF